MPRALAKLEDDALKAYLLNAIRSLETRPDEAESVVKDVLEEMASRWSRSPSGKHPLSAIGYNVQWKEWRAKERRALLDWLLVSELPEPLQRFFGPPCSRVRAAYLYRSIRDWKNRYGRGPGMEQAVSRWKADLDRIEAWAKKQQFQ